MALRSGFLLACCLVWLSGCASAPFAPPQADAGARAAAIWQEARVAHGETSFRALSDINVGYDGQWPWLITKLQPVLTDAQFRGRSEERLKFSRQPGSAVFAQQYQGPSGSKVVIRSGGGVQVAYNGQESRNAESLDAAALVADVYPVFLLGPLALPEQGLQPEYIGREAVGDRDCDVVAVVLKPGFGRSPADRAQFWFDRETRLMRRVRFTLEGLASTQGAIADVDVDAYISRHGVQWPTRFVERLVRPIPGLAVHDWSLLGLDVNRGYADSDLRQTGLSGSAAAPALPLKRP